MKKFPGVRSKTEFASLPMTQRAAGFAVDDVMYTVFSDRAAQFEAEKLIKENGIAGTIQLLESQENPDVHHAVASFAIQRILLDEAARVEETTPKEAKRLQEIARQMSANMSMRMTKAGRYVRAAGVILKNVTPIRDIATAIYQDVHGKGAELPADVVRRIEQKADLAKSDLAEVETLSKTVNSLRREIEQLKKALSGDVNFRKVSPQTAAARRRFATSIKSAHANDIAAAVERLRAASLIADESLSVELDSLDDIALMSIYDEPTLPEGMLEDFATYGADVLIDGLAKPDMMKPIDFDTAMTAAFGESVKPHLQQIHQEALRLRNKWIAEWTKDKQIKSIIAQFGEHLSEDDIDVIMQERADELRRRKIILEMHKLRAERGTRPEDIKAIEGIIAKIAESDAAAVAATAMIHKKPSAHELYRLLEAADIKGVDARNALRDGADVLERARLQHKKEKAAAENELRARINESDAELGEFEKQLSASRVRARESQREVSRELRRVGSGELRYRWGQLVELVNTPRAAMSSADVSFIFRQGGWFMVSRPKAQAEAFRRMWQAFGGKISEVGYDRAMEAMEQNPMYELARISGMDFAGLGKHGEFSITKGEEEFRNNAFKALVKLTEGTKAHAVNVARLPNAVIQKSDEIYTAFLDAQRLSAFAASAEAFQAMGMSFETHPNEFRALAAYINDATGRSVVRGAGVTNLIMQLPLFSPRFTVSRFRLLYKSTVGLPFLPPQTRKVVMKDAGKFYGAIGGITMLAWLAGLSAGLDWDDDDFLKIQIGDHHIDLFAGLQQALKPTLRAMTAIGRRALGSKYSFGLFRDSLYIKNDRGDILLNEFRHDMADVPGGIPARFLRSKLSPLPSLAVDYGYDEDFLGKKFNWTDATLSRIFPIGLADVAQAFYKDPATGTIALTALTGIGYGNYPDRPEKATTPAEKLASKINAMRMPDKVQDEQAAAVNERVADIKARGRRGEDVTSEIRTLQASGAITERRAKALIKGLDDMYFESKVMRMPSQMLREVRKVANDGERVVIDEILERRRIADLMKAPAAPTAPTGATIRPRR